MLRYGNVRKKSKLRALTTMTSASTSQDPLRQKKTMTRTSTRAAAGATKTSMRALNTAQTAIGTATAPMISAVLDDDLFMTTIELPQWSPHQT